MELAMEFDLPILVHTPHRDKKRGTLRSLEIIRASGFPEEKALIDHNNEETLPSVLDTGCWAGHSIYPNTKMDEARMVSLVQQYGSERIIINSAADWGVSDPLKVAKTVEAMRDSGIADSVIPQIVWDNPAWFFSQSGKLELEDIEQRPNINQTQLYDGNSVLRGQTPVVEA